MNVTIYNKIFQRDNAKPFKFLNDNRQTNYKIDNIKIYEANFGSIADRNDQLILQLAI